MTGITRAHDASALNEVVNHPSVWPHVAQEGQAPGSLDMSELVADARNFALMTDGGGLVFEWMEPGVYEVHTQFVEGHRGSSAVKATRAALEFMFTTTDAMELLSKVPAGNKGALGLVRLIHGEHEFDRTRAWARPDGEIVDVGFWALRYARWLWTAKGLEAKGKDFLDELDVKKALAGIAVAPRTADDLSLLRVLGATSSMLLGGQVAKGVMLFNRWSRFAGHGEIRLVNLHPVLLDIFDSYMWVGGDRWDVMPMQ